ncbi:hypothetical protein SAMN06297251_10213 [Fulvimarina manganoxydans]|uniref:Uncharacterized protein n=1 Tax=Fulvimarina manganoxydans TaxID=937218 RepID=A0A1W1YVF5_9HYPH|nr:hypothetical protein [Fulvimarina manganoxydans]MCK5932784.1 hypothetical protein [Fulvimarina manganoxydans]MEE2950856.1 hypothetical protein [Pseudomonadota bacterium]SMC40177.1 hypothetical protein SAMN06297251_10213 [Fulvimarina manganoxydans]
MNATIQYEEAVRELFQSLVDKIGPRERTTLLAFLHLSQSADVSVELSGTSSGDLRLEVRAAEERRQLHS